MVEGKEYRYLWIFINEMEMPSLLFETGRLPPREDKQTVTDALSQRESLHSHARG